jgi:hypothetical protein
LGRGGIAHLCGQQRAQHASPIHRESWNQVEGYEKNVHKEELYQQVSARRVD